MIKRERTITKNFLLNKTICKIERTSKNKARLRTYIFSCYYYYYYYNDHKKENGVFASKTMSAFIYLLASEKYMRWE